MSAPSGPASWAPGTFRPDPRRAGAPALVRAAAGLELRVVLRNGEQLLLALVIPLAALLGLTWTHVTAVSGSRIDAFTPGVLTLAMLSTGFTAQAITTGFDRRYGLLKRLAAAGISRSLLVAGKAVTALAVVAGQFVVVGGTALALGWRPHGDPAAALGLVVLGVATFVGLGLLLGGLLRAEAVLALANLLWLVQVALGGIVQPLTSAPAAVAAVGRLTPAGALSDALHTLWVTGHAPGPADVLVLLGWFVLGWGATVRWFRWW